MIEGGSPPVERTLPLIDAELARMAVAGRFVTMARVGVRVVKLRDGLAHVAPEQGKMTPRRSSDDARVMRSKTMGHGEKCEN